jgi:hypothetical protein
MIRCAICTEEILSPRAAYQRVAGWERPGKGVHGLSGSSLEVRERTGELAHPDCVAKLKAGVSPGQEVLV